jgi:hypothetical protein
MPACAAREFHDASPHQQALFRSWVSEIFANAKIDSKTAPKPSVDAFVHSWKISALTV